MKNKIVKILALLLLLPSLVLAQGSSDCWTGGLMLGNNKYVCGYTASGQSAVPILKVGSDGVVYYGTSGVPVVPNNTYIKARNAAGTASIDVLKVDGNDDTVINADSGDVIILSPGGTSEVTFDNGTITYTDPTGYIRSAGGMVIQADSDGQRAFTFDASSDTVQTLTFGDGGTTAAQELFIGASTADADDDGASYLLGGGGSSSTRGGRVTVQGNEYASTGGSAALVGGAIATGHVSLQTNHGSANVLLQPGGTTLWTANSTGEIIGAGTSTIGWTVKAGANTACTTTCVTPCVFGIDSASLVADIVACSDATADECLCAGAS